MMWGYDGMGWHWWGWFGMALFWLVPVLLIAAVVKYLAAKPGPGGGQQGQQETGKTALDYLEEAYAKGEISREEFLQKREDLKRK